MKIIPVKCPKLNLKEGKKSFENNPVLEVLLTFPEDDKAAYSNPTHILGCPEYIPHTSCCNANDNDSCIYSKDWKKLTHH